MGTSSSTSTGESDDVASVLGRDAFVCTTTQNGEAVISDILRTRGDAAITVTGVSLRSADNLSVVEARTVPVRIGGEEPSTFGTESWPMSDNGQWWWRQAAKHPGPLSGDLLLMVHFEVPDESRDGLAESMRITYSRGSASRTLDNSFEIKVARTCPKVPRA